MKRKLRIPIDDIVMEEADAIPDVSFPLHAGENWQANSEEFFLNVPGTGKFLAQEGKKVLYSTDPGADPDWVRLYLNGQVLVALLHQRKIINFHASSFIYNGLGIMVLGDTGSGKSSLTVSFALGGAGFMTDDLTPLIFRDGHPLIWPLLREVKLRADTIGKLDIDPGRLRKAEEGTGKHYFDINRARVSDFPLAVIFKIEIGECTRPEFREPDPATKFALLRSEICSWEILAGMPETEEAYMHQLLEIVRKVRIVRILRPAAIKISELRSVTEDFLTTGGT